MIIITCFFTNDVYAKETVRIVILPFKIHSIKELSYLQTEIPDVIKNHLKQGGAIVLEPDIVSDSSWKEKVKTIDEIRNIGVKAGADYVIWGSLTRIGQKFSLDAKMIKSSAKEPPNTFFKEGESIESLFGTVKKLAGNLGMKLFKLEKVAKVIITGNKRIEVDAIKRMIKTAPGDAYLVKNLTEDLKAIHSMGYFEDIRIEAENGPEGKTIIFKIKEKPTIRKISFKGNRIYADDEIKENLTIKTGSILNIFKVNNNIKRIEELYKDKNYHNVKITYKIHQLEHNQADLKFVIEEGKKVRIKEIIFIGNSAYTGKELQEEMKTSEKGFFSWLTASGDLNKEDLSQDISKLSAFYHNNGHIHAKISDPQIEFKDKWIYITIKIDEGLRFKVGRVDIEGDILLSKEDLFKRLKITEEKYYNHEVVRNDILMFTDLYSDEGYAYVNISPRINKDVDKLKVDITYVINKGKSVYFESIIIGGNTKTRDKVIRRELKVYEQELYRGQQLKRGIRNLYRLDFFEDIKVNMSKGDLEDRMILKIDVTEKPTGQFSFGGGYSSVEKFYGMISISERNLFGRGQTIQLKGNIGEMSKKYMLSFTEPWMFDIPLSAGFDLYDLERDYDYYDKDSVGGGVRCGYLVYDFTRVYFNYKYDVGDIKNIDEDASQSIKELEGINITRSISTTLRYDSRDRIFNPTEGSDHSITVQYAGFGGNIAFTKYRAKTGWYIPLFRGTVGFLHAKTGYVTENPDGKLPDYERFYLGGMNSLRGFKWREISTKDDAGDEIGGNKFVQFNFEFLLPLIKEAGIVGVIFYDTGNVYNDNESIDLNNMREGAGYGFRWYSPIGPIRLENGYILDPKEGESKSGRWEFTISTIF